MIGVCEKVCKRVTVYKGRQGRTSNHSETETAHFKSSALSYTWRADSRSYCEDCMCRAA